MSSIFDMIVQDIGTSGAGVIADKLGISESVAQTAIAAGLPMILGALGRNSADQAGAEALDRALARDHDGSILNDLLGALGGSGQVDAGSAILNHVLGNKQTVASRALGQSAGIDASSANELLAMLAPIVLGELGKTKQQQGLNASDLSQLLQGERKTADSQLGGLSRLLDMDGDGDVTDDMLKMGSSLLGRLFK